MQFSKIALQKTPKKVGQAILREGSFLTLDFQVTGTCQVPVTLATVIYEFSLSMAILRKNLKNQNKNQ